MMGDPLLQRAREGDHDAFLDLIGQHDRQLMSVVCRFTSDLYDREDLYQDIFLHCYRSLATFSGRSRFRTWLYRLALNRCLDWVKKRVPVMAPVDEGEAVDWERREKLAAVARAMANLSGKQRICFHLCYVEDWTVAEIAEFLGAREGTVKSHLERARRKIRQDREVLVWQTT